MHLYHTDEGVVGDDTDEGVVGDDTDLDTRNLSPSGKEAWVTLLRARYNALKEAGKDPHVLFTSSSRRRNSCICGIENSADSAPLGVEHSALLDDADLEDDNGQRLPSFEEAEPTPVTFGFDWDAWDALATFSSTPLV